MKTSLCCEVLKRLQGRTLATAESITGGGIGSAITSVSGASAVYICISKNDSVFSFVYKAAQR